MKRNNNNFIALMMLAVVCLLSPSTASAVPRLNAGVVRGFPGRTVDVPITLRYRTNDLRDVVALQADVVFDTTGLTEGPLTVGPITSGHVVDSSNPTTGTRRLLVYSPANSVLTNGEIARIPFTVAPNAFRNFTLRLENVIMVRADASQVFGTVASGAIAVTEVFLGDNGMADGFINVSTNDSERCFVIQATTDFRNWVNVQTNCSENTLLTFVDPNAGSYPRRFYRALPLAVAGQTLVATGEVWRYQDDGSDQGAAWQSFGFDDSRWKFGPSPLGYGNGDEATTVGSGPDENRFITTYFRRSFVAPDASLSSPLTLRLRRDDGAVVYLNGTEVLRNNMPTAAAIRFDTLASDIVVGDDETNDVWTCLPASLRSGTNVLAVEIHQVSPGSSDISFDLELTTGSLGIPNLSVRRAGPETELAWPGWAVCYALEESDTLAAVTTWRRATNSISSLGGQRRTVVPATKSTRFYRLRKD